MKLPILPILLASAFSADSSAMDPNPRKAVEELAEIDAQKAKDEAQSEELLRYCEDKSAILDTQLTLSIKLIRDELALANPIGTEVPARDIAEGLAHCADIKKSENVYSCVANEVYQLNRMGEAPEVSRRPSAESPDNLDRTGKKFEKYSLLISCYREAFKVDELTTKMERLLLDLREYFVRKPTMTELPSNEEIDKGLQKLGK